MYNCDEKTFGIYMESFDMFCIVLYQSIQLFKIDFLNLIVYNGLQLIIYIYISKLVESYALLVLFRSLYIALKSYKHDIFVYCNNYVMNNRMTFIQLTINSTYKKQDI